MSRRQLVALAAGAATMLSAVACSRTESPPPGEPGRAAAPPTAASGPSPAADSTPSTAPPRTIWSYTCDDGTQVTAEPLEPAGDLVVTTPDRSARLWLEERGAGRTTYESRKLAATIDGDLLLLKIEGRARLTCRRNPATSE